MPHAPVRRLLDNGPINQDPFSLVTTRSVAMGLASFRTVPTNRFNADEGSYEGTERWSQEAVDGHWVGDGRLHELLSARLRIDRPARQQQRLPILPAMGVVADVIDRLGGARWTGFHVDLPLALSSDSWGDVARGADWFLVNTDQPSADFVATIRLADADATEAIRHVLGRYEAVWRDVTPTVVPVSVHEGRAAERAAFDGEPGASVVEEHQTPSDPTVALHCTASEWSVDLAAWTVELLSQVVKTAVGAERCTIRIALC